MNLIPTHMVWRVSWIDHMALQDYANSSSEGESDSSFIVSLERGNAGFGELFWLVRQVKPEANVYLTPTSGVHM